MAVFTEKMKELISKQGTFALATASKSGVPNVVPIGMLFVKTDDTIWIIDNFMDKTLSNLKENPVASFYVWDGEGRVGCQIKGNVSIEDAGADYEEAVAFAHSKKETLPAKSLLKFKLCSAYDVTPGPNAGKKLD